MDPHISFNVFVQFWYQNILASENELRIVSSSIFPRSLYKIDIIFLMLVRIHQGGQMGPEFSSWGTF